MIARAARDIQPGMTVNLGIGLPTKVVNFIPKDFPVCFHSENGISGVGPVLSNDDADRNLIDAGGAYVSPLPGTAYFDSATSFAMVRSGRLSLTLLGAFQVAANGDLANWKIPGVFAPGIGGAVELAQKARKVAVLTTHCDKKGRSKIVETCSLPLTAKSCVDRIYTDMAVIDVSDNGLVLREVAEGLTVSDVVAATDAKLNVPAGTCPTF
ncbi:3-oxoacid CoA-transferase subunit B [Rhodobacteraceae bacterium RKSG542]|nr:3-oxoacid CoA-transferase subunit B [Pseudovibrio flavus]MTI16435.1 3-oxoacid CoA-transferase subunit B [Pseudovibrio flavus]